MRLLEQTDDALGLPLAHEAVLDEHRPETLAEGAVGEHGDRGRIDSSGEGVDRGAVADGVPDRRDLFFDEAVGIETAGGDLRYHPMTSLRRMFANVAGTGAVMWYPNRDCGVILPKKRRGRNDPPVLPEIAVRAGRGACSSGRRDSTVV
jgi:hypothetical protein